MKKKFSSQAHLAFLGLWHCRCDFRLYLLTQSFSFGAKFDIQAGSDRFSLLWPLRPLELKVQVHCYCEILILSLSGLTVTIRLLSGRVLSL
jgi:hypothetical protein